MGKKIYTYCIDIILNYTNEEPHTCLSLLVK